MKPKVVGSTTTSTRQSEVGGLMSVKIGEVIFAEIQRWGCKPDILTHGVSRLGTSIEIVALTPV